METGVEWDHRKRYIRRGVSAFLEFSILIDNSKVISWLFKDISCVRPRFLLLKSPSLGSQSTNEFTYNIVNWISTDTYAPNGYSQAHAVIMLPSTFTTVIFAVVLPLVANAQFKCPPTICQPTMCTNYCRCHCPTPGGAIYCPVVPGTPGSPCTQAVWNTCQQCVCP